VLNPGLTDCPRKTQIWMLSGANLNIRRHTSIEFQENTMRCPTSRWCALKVIVY